MPVFPSYRNQSTDLHSKSIDWFLYEGNTDTPVKSTRKSKTSEVYLIKFMKEMRTLIKNENNNFSKNIHCTKNEAFH